MSALITGALNITVGLISRKIRSYYAQKLQNGGLVDKKFRDLIVSELDDIHDKLDSIALKELKSGISCFKTGVDRLTMSFGDSVDGSGGSQIPSAIQKQSENSLTSGSGMPDIEQILTIAQAVGKLKTISNNRYERAEESFKDAVRDARMAFCNSALHIKDRILACKVRIASEILGNLADPDFAAVDCVGHLRELHELPSIFEIFDVQTNGVLKRLLNTTERIELIESVIMINLSLLDFIKNFAEEKRNSLITLDSWPLIVSDTTVYHPLYYEISTRVMLEVTEISPPWCIRINNLLNSRAVSAVNSKGDIILYPNPTQNSLAKLDRKTCTLQTLTKGDKDNIKRNYLAVDEDDTVYLLTRYGGQSKCYNLCVCDTSGKIENYPVEFLNGKECHCFGVNKEKTLGFCCEFEKSDCFIYISDRNGQLKNCIPARMSDNQVKDMFCSNSNEIILVVVTSNNSSSTIYLYVYSMEGHLNRIVKLKLPSRSGSANSCTVRYDYRRQRYICLASTMMGDGRKIVEFCPAGELKRSCDLSIKHLGLTIKPHLSSHPNGIVALVCQNGALFI